MPKLIPTEDSITPAREQNKQARELPVPTTGLGKSDFSYIANVKDLFRQAKDLVKFIPQKAGVTAEMKEEVTNIYAEIEQAKQDILGYSGRS
jgi:hypothetical protein